MKIELVKKYDIDKEKNYWIVRVDGDFKTLSFDEQEAINDYDRIKDTLIRGVSEPVVIKSEEI